MWKKNLLRKYLKYQNFVKNSWFAYNSCALRVKIVFYSFFLSELIKYNNHSHMFTSYNVCNNYLLSKPNRARKRKLCSNRPRLFSLRNSFYIFTAIPYSMRDRVKQLHTAKKHLLAIYQILWVCEWGCENNIFIWFMILEIWWKIVLIIVL